nr:uncharacterized protein LOC113708109 [Coffea arabica]
MTDQPLKQILSKPEASGRMVRWAVELSEYDLSFQPRTAIKAQALADFIAEGVSFGQQESQDELTRDTAKAERAGEAAEVAQAAKSELIQDAAETRQAGEAAEVTQATKTSKAEQTIDAAEAKQGGEPAEVIQATKEAKAELIGNTAEAEQARNAVEAEQARNAVEVEQAAGKVGQSIPTWTLFVDRSSSKERCRAGLLLTSPMGDELAYALRFDFRASNNESEYETLVAGMMIARKLGAESIEVYSDSQLIVNQVGGSYEVKEEPLRKYVAKVHELRAQFKLFTLKQVPRNRNKRADALSKLASTSVGTLNKEVLMEVVRNRAYDQLKDSSRVEARRVLLKSRGYELSGGVLYKKSYLRPWLRCITPEEGDYILRELHEGICGNHVGPRVLAKKGMLSGYYWPTIFLDSAELIDLLGPFPRAPGGYEHVVVAVDYFTKWVEAEPLATISSRSVQNFLWRNIVCRFGILRVLVSDNGRQFADSSLQGWCAELGIRQHFTSVGHPQANGQVENVNRTILHGLKMRMESARTGWLDELPTILWAYRTTPRTATQEIPFALTYGAEAVIPAEIGVPSDRVQNFIALDNEDELRLNLDLLEGRREEAAIRMAKYKGQIARHYNVRVRPLSFKPGDLVLRKNSVSRLQGTGKLGPNWEGPYVVKEANRAGYCKLTHLSGEEVPRTWHNSNLRIFH